MRSSILDPRSSLTLLCALIGLFAAGCRKEDMADQPRFDPMEHSNFFADGQASRPLVEGTVPRGHRTVHEDFFAVSSGATGGPLVEPESTSFPRELSRADLAIGQQKFDINCSLCHGRLGDGRGMIVQRGFPAPPSLVVPSDRTMTERERNLQNLPVGHYYNVITHGYGAMYSYGDRILPEDRWRIVGYVKALQLSASASAAPTTQPR